MECLRQSHSLSAAGATRHCGSSRTPLLLSRHQQIPAMIGHSHATPSQIVRLRSICHSTKKGDAAQALNGLKTALQGSTIEPAYLTGAAYLRTMGIMNQAEIARVLDVAMNPNSLFVSFSDGKRSRNANARLLDVETDMRPVVDYLTDMTSVSDVIKIVSQHPPVLSYSVEDRLKPFFVYMKSIGVVDVGAVIIKRPSLLGLDVNNNLKKIVEYLQYVDTPTETIIKYLETSI